MAIKRYFATKDNTITNAFKSNLTTRGTGSNMGQADILEVFSILGQASSSSGLSSELSRVLIEFDTTDIAADRTAGTIPASGSVSFYLKMFNAKHGQTLPKNYTMEIKAVTGSAGTREWEEGLGLDMEGYTDVGACNFVHHLSTLTNAVGRLLFTGTVAGASGTQLTIRNADSTSVTFTTDSSKDETASTATLIGTSGVDTATKAATSVRNAISAAITAGTLKISVSDVDDAQEGSGAKAFFLTQSTAGRTGNTTITNNISNVGANDFGQIDAIGSITGIVSGSGDWSTAGGDYANPDTDLSSSFTQTFDDGTEDLEIDVTTLVEQWLNSAGNVLGVKNNYGVGVMLSSSHETENRSYYTKKFFARSSEFFFKRPVLEARFDSRELDNRGNLIYSSSLATADENLNKIYLYNYFRGQLRNIPSIGTDNIYVSLFSGSADDSSPSGSALELVVDGTHVTDAARNTVITGSFSSTGIYTASVALTAASTPLETVYDVWFSGSDDFADASQASIQFQTGSIKPQLIEMYASAPSDEHVTNITNLKPVYSTSETARFRVYIREKDWCPTVYNVSSRDAENKLIESGSYKVFRIIDELDVVPYGTGSDLHTAMSYDVSGNYFDLDMSMLESDYMYGIKFAYYNNSIGSYVEQPEVFKFRVEK